MVTGRSDAMETSRTFDMHLLDKCRTVLHDIAASGSSTYLTYTGVPWTIRIRKEVSKWQHHALSALLLASVKFASAPCENALITQNKSQLTQMDPRDALRHVQLPIALLTKVDVISRQRSSTVNNTWLSPSVVSYRPTSVACCGTWQWWTCQAKFSKVRSSREQSKSDVPYFWRYQNLL